MMPEIKAVTVTRCPRPLDDTPKGGGIRTHVLPMQEEVTVTCAPGIQDLCHRRDQGGVGVNRAVRLAQAG